MFSAILLTSVVMCRADHKRIQQILRLKLSVQLAKTLVPIGRFGERREKIGDDLLRTLSGGEREKAQHTPPGIGVGQLHDKLFDDVVCGSGGGGAVKLSFSLPRMCSRIADLL